MNIKRMLAKSKEIQDSTLKDGGRAIVYFWDLEEILKALAEPEEPNLQSEYGAEFKIPNQYEVLPPQKDKPAPSKDEPFGVGDILEAKSGKVCQVAAVYPDWGEGGPPGFLRLRWSDGNEGVDNKYGYKLIFPTSKIPKELYGIRCAPKGDVVEVENGCYAMVLGIDNYEGNKLPFSILTWDPREKVFYNRHYRRNEIKRTLWRNNA